MGLRERKKRATRTAIHDAAMRLFEERGFARTTVDQIAEQADVSRATVFTYFPTKEDIVFGEAPQAIAALDAMLAEAATAGGTAPAVRGWLRELSGWLEPRLLLQRRLAQEVPVVAATRVKLFRDAELAIAAGLERELGAEEHLSARLAAAALVAALAVAEDTAATRMEEHERALSAEEVDALIDDAFVFAEAGIEALRATAR